MTDAVERVTLRHLQVPLKESSRIAGVEVTIKDAILVAVESNNGVGLGECSPIPARDSASESRLSPEGCWRELSDRIAPSLLGQTFTEVEEIAELAGTWEASPIAAAGAETACWDLLGQARHEAIAETLGALGSPLDLRIESGLSVGLYPTIVELIKTIDTHLAEGYRRVKIQIEPGRDIELVRAVRQHFGDIPLMVDGAEAYEARHIDVLRELDEFDLLMIEQPIAAEDLDGLAALQKEVATPICLDETANRLDRAAEAIRRRAGRIVNLKLQRVGGFGPALAMHNLCQEKGVACWVGTMPELGVGQAQGLHLAALPNCKYPTDIEPSVRWFVDDCVVPLIEFSSPGVFMLPSRPGLGYHVDPVKLKRYQVRQREFSAKTSA
jgi:O-succinylbenzoate synthase